MIFGGVGVSDGVDAGGGGSGCEPVGDRIGWVPVVGQCWVAFCVGLLLVRVSHVLVFWWVLGSLVLPMVPPLVSGVSTGEGVVASGLGVGGGAGVRVVVPGPGVGGCGCSPLLAAGLVGPPLRPSGFWRPCSPPGGGGLLGSCCLGLCVLRVWCGRRLHFGVWCALVGLVSVAVVGVCVVCTLGRVCGVFVVPLGACPRLCGRGLAALFGVGAVCRAPPPVSAVWFPAPLGWGPLVVCPLAVPFACPPPSVSFRCRLGRCRARAFPVVVCGGGSLSPARVPSPGVSPWGGRCLHSPSGCNSVVRMPSMDLFRSQVLQPFPTPGSGTLWVAGESLRDRRVSCLPRWTVCPTRSPSLGPNRSTCRGECSWSGPLVTPPGRCHRGPLTNGPGRIPPYCVCSGGADTVTGGAPKPLRLGPSPAPPVGPFRPAPLFAVRFAVVGVPSLLGGVVVVGGGFFFAVPGCVACGRVAPSSGRGSPPVCVFVARCVRAWCLCWCVVRGLWCVVCGGGVLVGLWRVCGVVGPSPLLAEVPVCYSPPLLAGFRCLWCCAAPRHSWLGFRRRQWRVVCGVWSVVYGERWRCVGRVVAGVWCGWSLATPGRGSRVLLPATPGWVSLRVVVGGPRHSWLRSPGGGGVWWGCGWCVVCLVPRHSWRRFLCATPRHSWLGFAACGGVRFPATPGWGLLAAVVRGVCCVVCGVWCAAVVCWWGCGCGWSLATPGGGSCVLLPATPGWVSMPVAVGGPRHSWLRALGAVPRHSWLGFAGGSGVWWGCGWCVVWLVPRHSWRSFLCATPRHSWLGFAAGGGVRFPATPGWGLLAVVVRGVWCVVCGGGVLAGLWVVCGVVGPSPLLAEVPVCYSPLLLAGFRCRWWWAVPATPGWGPLAAVVCGVCRWCVGGWSLATPGGVSCVLLPATPGWVSLLVVVGGPRHSWLGSVGGGVWRGRSLATPGGGSCVLLPATPGWVSVPVVVCGPPPLLAGVRSQRWCVVCGVWCVVCGVWCVVCGGGVLVGLRLVCGVVGSSPLPAEVPVCYSPPLLAGFRCRRWWAFLATPGGGSRARFPATPGWVSLSAVVCGVRCVVCGVWRAAVACVVGLWLVWLVPRHSWRRFLCATPRHSWLGFAAGGGVVWWCGGRVFRVPFPLALVCVCALCGPSCWCGWRGGGGGVALGVAVVRARVCARGVWLVGWGVSYLGWFSSSVVGMFQKAEEEVLYMRSRDAWHV